MKKLSFTLIEMAMVVLLVWLMAAATVPRVMNTKLRADNTKRFVDLRLIGWWVITYQNERWGVVPEESMTTIDKVQTWLDTYLVPQYITSMPLDPMQDATLYNIWIFDYIYWWIAAWQDPAPGSGGWAPWVTRPIDSIWAYWYVPLTVNSNTDTTFALMAMVDSPEYANRIFYPAPFWNSRDLFVYYGAWTYTYISTWASLTKTLLTNAIDIKNSLCDKVDISSSYNYPAHIMQANWRYTCYPANNNPIAAYWYNNRDSFLRMVYIP